MYQDPIERLLQEHKEIMAQVAELRAAVHSLAEEGEAALSQTLPVFDRIGQMMATRLDLHRRKEDDILFPEFEAVFGTEGSATSVMRREHQEIHAQGRLLRETLHDLNEVQHPAIEAGGAELRTLAASGDDAEALRSTGEEIIHLLDLHFEKEEQILFPMAPQLLTPEAIERVAIGFERLESEFVEDR